MTAYIKTLYDSTKTDILYPQTLAQAVFTNDEQNLETVLNNKLTIPTGTQGQLLGFTEDNVIGAVNPSSGGVNIEVSSVQPTNQKTGDFWYQIV